MAKTLFDYMQECQVLIHDTSQQFVDPADIIRFINRARREIAMRLVSGVFGAFMLVAGVMTTREDVLARGAKSDGVSSRSSESGRYWGRSRRFYSVRGAA